MAVGCVNGNDIHLGINQCLYPFQGVACDAHGSGAQQAAVGILGAVGVFMGFLNILNSNQPPQMVAAVHQGQLFNAMGSEDFFRFL